MPAYVNASGAIDTNIPYLFYAVTAANEIRAINLNKSQDLAFVTGLMAPTGIVG
jgi:hypothetical protein